MTADPEVVILRRWRQHPRTVIALWPLQPDGPGVVQSYEHVGQHGPAGYGSVVSRTRPVDASDPDAVALLDELRRIGYRPIVRKRRPR